MKIKNFIGRFTHACSRLKIGTRILALLLSVILIFYVVPSVVYAEIAKAFESSGSEIADAAQAGQNNINIYDYKGAAYELTDSREESTKHFHLEDGSYVAAHYNYPVHYVDESGEYRDIDNALFEDSSGEFSNSNARIKFAKKITGNGSLFTLHDGNTKITFSLIGANKGTVGTVTNGEDAESDTELQKLMNLEKLSSSVIYRDILPGVDVEYITESLNIKENVIIKKKSDSYSYTFELKLNGLVAALSENGDIEITDENTKKVKYVIPAPVLYDSDGTYAPKDAAFYTLKANGKKYTLALNASSEWMNAPERVYPVILDPAIESATGAITERFISPERNVSPSVSSPNYPIYNTANTETTTGIIYWKTSSLPTLPETAYISNVTFNLYSTTAFDTGAVSPFIFAYNVGTNWTNSLTWAEYISEDGTAGILDTTVIDYCKTVFRANPFNLTALVSTWYRSPSSNRGVAFMVKGGPITFSSSFYSSVPALTVSYSDLMGMEDYWSYSSHSVGYAGSGAVNVANGNLTLSIPTLSTTDSLMPTTLSLIYNSRLANSPYVYNGTETAYGITHTSFGYKFNISETLIKKSFVGADGTNYYYVYADSDGTEHGFYKSTEGANIYVDESGLQLTLTEVSDSNGNITSITIADNSKVTRTFSKMSYTPASEVLSAWYLTKIEDVNKNAVVFTCDTANNYRPTMISLKPKNSTQIDFISISYNSIGKPNFIYNSTSRDAVILRYSHKYNTEILTDAGNYLKEVNYVKGTSGVSDQNWSNYIASSSNTTNITHIATAKYTYNSVGYMTKAEDVTSQRSVKYTWNSGKLTKIQETGVSSAVGQSIGYTYGIGYTDVTSSGSDDYYGNVDDISTRYVFDDYGRAISMYSGSKYYSEIYGATTGKYETQENVKNNLKEQTTLGGNAVNYLLNGDFEDQLSYWTTSGSVSAYANLSFEGDGMYGARLSPTSSAPSSISQTLFLTAGEYTLSFLYNTANADGVSGSVTIESLSGSGLSVNEEISKSRNYNNGIKSSFVTTFTVPNHTTDGGDKVKITVTFNKSAAATNTPTIIVDRVMLENNVGASSFSLVTYGSFDANGYAGTSAVALSTFWKTETGSSPTIVTDYDAKFGKAVKISGAINESRYVKQRIFTENADYLQMIGNYQSVGTDYIVSGFGLANNAVYSKNAAFRIRVDVIYYNQSTGADSTVSHYFDFAPGCKGWQFTGGTFSTKYKPDGTAAVGKVKAIDVYCEYSNQPNGYAYFDNISVVNVDSNSVERYFYYENGLMQRKENIFYIEMYEYDANRNLTRVVNNRGDITDYVYKTTSNTNLVDYTVDYTFTYLGSVNYPFAEDDPDSLITKTAKTKTKYTYNTYGLTTAITTYPVNDDLTQVSGSKKLYNCYVYNTTANSKIFGSLKNEYDSLDVDIRYYYDQTNGRLLATVNSDTNTGTAYTYDSKGNLTSVTPATYVSSTIYSSVSGAESVEYTYNDRNLLTTITTESTTYTFNYDAFGNATSVGAGNNTLASYTYNDYNGKINKITYGNGFSEEYVYNGIELLKEVWYNYTDGTRTLAYEYEYTSDGQVYKFVDNINEKTTVYKYDTNGRVIGFVEYEHGEEYNDYSSEVYYNDRDELQSTSYYLNHANGNAIDFAKIYNSYNYETDGRLKSSYIRTTVTDGGESYTYDEYDRVSKKVTNLYLSSNTATKFNNEINYTYKTYSDRTSSWVETYKSTVNGASSVTYTYSYDQNGNITKISYSTGGEIRYVYDDLSQLIREDNEILNKTLVYTYDNAGNITSIKTYALTAAASTPTNPTSTKSYSYTSTNGWGDQLTSFNGTAITYDGIGNPLVYYNGVNFSWTGRQLTEAVNGSNTYSFTYNDEGIRTSKTVNGVTTTYYLSGTQIVAEETNGNITLYLYDSEGLPVGMQYHGASYAEDAWDIYWFERNLQGDIVAVYDKFGTKVISYTYDAWGNFVDSSGANTTATLNPFRYRGYYYDSDLGLYYLNSRYYDPNTGRFISADNEAVITATPTALTDKNLYAYCDNNPIMRRDDGGEFWKQFVGALTGVIEQFASDLMTSAIDGEFKMSSFSTYLGAAVGGAVGASIPGDNDIVEDIVSSAVTTATSMIGNNIQNSISGEGEIYSFEEIYYTTVNSVMISAVTSGAIETSKLGKKLKDVGISQKLDLNAKDIFSAFASSVVDVCRNYFPFSKQFD